MMALTATLAGSVTVVSLVAGSCILIYGLSEARLDYREHAARVAMLERIEQEQARRPGGERPAERKPGEDLGEEFGGGPVDPGALLDSLAKFTEALKGLPRSIQAFLVASLFYAFALVVALVEGATA